MIKPPEPDPRIQRFENGAAVLRSKGQLAGYVLSTVGTFWSPFRPLRRQWWIWFLVVWADGKRERPVEDYPPDWLTVDELERGQFSGAAQTVTTVNSTPTARVRSER